MRGVYGRDARSVLAQGSGELRKMQKRETNATTTKGNPMNEELLESLLSSLADMTDELWTIRWNHFLSYLGYELPKYLRRFCPAPEQVLYQFVSALDPKYQRYFGPSKFDEWKVVVERKRELAAEKEPGVRS